MGCSSSLPERDPNKTPGTPPPGANSGYDAKVAQDDKTKKSDAVGDDAKLTTSASSSVVHFNNQTVLTTQSVEKSPKDSESVIGDDNREETAPSPTQVVIAMADAYHSKAMPVPKEDTIKNDVTDKDSIPEPLYPYAPVDFHCLYGSASAKWPIPCLAALDMNVNAYHGGCAGLVLCSNHYGGKGEEGTAEMFLCRSGFSGNHKQMTSLIRGNSGHFGTRNVWVTDEDGKLNGDLMFGTNHVAFMSSDPRHGNLSGGVRVEAEPDETTTALPLNINAGSGSGNSLLLCSGWESSSGDSTSVSAAYFVRSGNKDNFQQTKLLKGDDKWSFSVQDGFLSVTGPGKSVYSLYHNRTGNVDLTRLSDSHSVKARALAGHAQAVNGPDGAILPGVGASSSGLLLVLCSNSSGEAEEATCAAVYSVALDGVGGVTANYVNGTVGNDYGQSSPDLWTFASSANGFSVKGPVGPCRYGYLSNFPASNSSSATLPCLASGEEMPTQGAVDIDNKRLIGWVNKATDIKIIVDECRQSVIPAGQMKKVGDDKFAFAHTWTEKERSPGFRVVTVGAVRSRIHDGSSCYVNLTGSPKGVAWQPPGVIYGVNCTGQSYEALDGIIYESEFSKFANYTKDYMYGTRCRALGMEKTNASNSQLVACSQDGFLYVKDRTPYAEAVDEKRVVYEVNDLPNGTYTLRLHTIRLTFDSLVVNGQNVAKQLDKQLQKRSEVIPGATGRFAEIPVKITDNTLTMDGTRYHMAAFALYDKSFKPREKNKNEKDEDEKTRKKLSDSLAPLSRTMTRKERKLIGWSRNLLANSSAEKGDMSSWSTSGSWVIHDGGYGTEKAFKTSHMWCSKLQQVDLTEEFTTDYLDTGPTIEVEEWYREGVCGGGHYYFKACLLDGSGNVLAEHVLPETGRLYNNNKWMQEKASFRNYGPGARSVYLETRGKDDKFWGGHYGTIMSAALVRVQRQADVPDDDAYEDVKMTETEEEEVEHVKLRDKIVSDLFIENKDTLLQLVQQEDLPESAVGLTVLGRLKRPEKKKKREIRVFVSSTFRDFTLEREELIKKTFREINIECANRGVFFTYVDLRWGITETQTETGQTIAICLQEIDRCRPYFICMMGDRYGWARKEGDNDKVLDDSFTYAVENFPTRFQWIEKYRTDTSVTMLEILHGVLNNVDLNRSRSFFYLRNSIQPEEVDGERYKRVMSESEWHKDRQNQLRRMVEEKPDLNVRRYKQPLDVCDKIKKDLIWCLDNDFPKGTELTPLEREREAHIAFADARCRVYIGREDYFKNITNFVNEAGESPLVILGESGSGKSALVANWVRRAEDIFPNAFIFVHFIGSSAESASYIKLLRRLYEEMKLFYGFQLAIPQTDNNLISHLPMWLRMAGEVPDSRCIIVLDALNQLDSGTGSNGAEHDLLWIPRRLPPGVNIVLSTLPGRAMDAVEKAGWKHIKVDPLQESEKMQIVIEYLEGIYGKTLSEDQKQTIVSSPQTNNPLYLKALLDEVRMYGNFRTLTAKIGDYLVASNPPELFACILSRFEEDFEGGDQKRPGMVRQMASAIWCSHKGMSEAELLELLQVPSPVWSPFYLSVVENLVNRNGILNFFHDHLRQAVEAKYLPDKDDKTKGYLMLANYFSSRPVDSRVAEELPFLLTNAGELDRLKTVVSDLTMFRHLIKTEEGKFDLIKAWTKVGGFGQTEDIYIKELEKIQPNDVEADELSELKQQLAEFFIDLGLYGAARAMLEALLEAVSEKYKATHSTIILDAFSQSRKYLCNHPKLIDLLHTLGSVCEKQKDFDKALDYFTKAITLQKHIDSSAVKLQLTEGILGRASALYQKNDAQASKRFLLRAQELATEVLGPRHHYVSAIINKIGQLSYRQGRLDEALAYYLHDLRLTRADVGLGHPRVAGIINDIALVYDDHNDPRTGQFYEIALQILLARYGQTHLDVAVIRFNLGTFLFATFYLDKAKFQFTEALRVYELFLGSDHPETQECKNALNDVVSFGSN